MGRSREKNPSAQIFRSIFINSIMRGIVFCCCVIVFNRNGNKKIITLIAESIKPSIHSFLLYRNRKLKVLVKRIIGFFSHLLLNGARCYEATVTSAPPRAVISR